MLARIGTKSGADRFALDSLPGDREWLRQPCEMAPLKVSSKCVESLASHPWFEAP
jgi:hypothetical protein